MKMYPAGYTLGPHAFDYSKQYVHSAPQYAVPVARAPLPEAQPYVHQRHVVVKPIQYTYASLPPAQPPARIYRYDNQQVPGLPPMSPATTDRPFSEAAAKWTWDNSGGSRGYAAPPPFESMGSFPEVGLRTLSTLPENTPRDGYFSASLPKIVEVVRVEGEAGPVKPSDKYVPKPAGDEDFAQSEPEDEGDNRKPEMERTTTTAQVDTQAEDSENRESSETPREEEQDDSRNKMSPANNNEDEVQEGEQAEDTASSEASSELMSGEEPPFTEETQLGEKKEDVQRNEEEGEGNKGFEGEGKKGEEKLFSKQMEDESQISGAAANNNYGKNFKVKFDSQATDENLKHFPMFSMTTASTFSGIDFMTTPRLGKMEEGSLHQLSIETNRPLLLILLAETAGCLK
ncbi:hypothetical protein Emag_003772 [Eimeria magna]